MGVLLNITRSRVGERLFTGVREETKALGEDDGHGEFAAAMLRLSLSLGVLVGTMEELSLGVSCRVCLCPDRTHPAL